MTGLPGDGWTRARGRPVCNAATLGGSSLRSWAGRGRGDSRTRCRGTLVPRSGEAGDPGGRLRPSPLDRTGRARSPSPGGFAVGSRSSVPDHPLFLLACAAIVLLAAVDPPPACADAASPRAAIPAIVAAFASHPVVAIAEAHQLREAGDFYVALVRAPAFQRTVDDIVVEFASRQSQPLLDRYVVAGDSLPPDTLASIWRNTTKAASWE